MPVPLPPWRAVLTAALQRHRTQPISRYLQLATVDDGGRPHNRTVVFRGFGPASEVLVLTDARSGKVAHLQRNPAAEACWYFAGTREQFRLTLHIALHDASATGAWAVLRRDLWQARKAAGQAEWLGFVPDAPLAEPVDAFVLLAGTVQVVDHLSLRPSPHEQVRYALTADGWQVSPVAPLTERAPETS